MSEKVKHTLTRQAFIRFLKELKIYDKFKRNLFDPTIRFSDALDDNCKEFYVSDAFSWENSGEGEDFWSDVDTMWYDVMDEMYGKDISNKNMTAIKQICKELQQDFYY